MEARSRDVERLETRGETDPESNVLFGEGGAGAFSDGKLTCGLNSPHIRTVLDVYKRQVQPYAISASGTLTDLAVRPGDEVHPGDYLFSYVPDVLGPALRGEANPTAVKMCIRDRV